MKFKEGDTVIVLRAPERAKQYGIIPGMFGTILATDDSEEEKHAVALGLVKVCINNGPPFWWKAIDLVRDATPKSKDDFANKHPGGILLQHGGQFVIVYDWHHPWDGVRAEAERIKAYRDVDGVRWYFVLYAGMHPVVHEFDSERLEYFTATLHQELRNRAN